jgi:uncharacterized protein YlxW (UPF0749 family)
VRLFKTLSLTLVCILLGITIAWQYKSVNTNQVLAQYEKKNLGEIVDELLAERSKNENLSAMIENLQREVEFYQSGEKSGKQQVEELEKAVLNARIMAGLETVKGTGLVIMVESGDQYRVRASHIQELLNELKASDVQALCVNDERIVATSEVREAGDYIMINGRQLVPPYTIKAIGDPDKMEKSLRLMGGVLNKYENYGFTIQLLKEDNVVIPGVRDDGTILRIDKLSPVER